MLTLLSLCNKDTFICIYLVAQKKTQAKMCAVTQWLLEPAIKAYVGQLVTQNMCCVSPCLRLT